MAAGGISIHAVDARDGLPAEGMHVDVFRVGGEERLCIAAGRIGARALLDVAELGQPQEKGRYEVHFHAGAYFDARSGAGALPPLLDVVAFAFEIADPDEHVHLPLKMTPAGYSLFRGDP